MVEGHRLVKGAVPALGGRHAQSALSAEEYGIAVRKAEVTLADELNAQLIAVCEDGTLDAIRAAWFANDVTTIAKYASEYKK